MDQPSTAEKGQNDADTSDLDVLSRPSSSTPHHRPGHSGGHRHHKSHHHSESHHHGESHLHGLSHHHGGSHHLGDFQDFHDNAFSRHSHHSPHSHHSTHHGEASHHGGTHHSTNLALPPSRGTVFSHHSYGEDHSDDEHHHGSRRYNGRPHHRNESYLHGGPSHHDESYHHGDPRHHDESYLHGGPPHHGESYHPGTPHHQGESYHHGGAPHHGESYLYGGPHHRGGPHHHGVSHHPSEVSRHSGLHHQGEPYYHKESYHSGGPRQHIEGYHHGGPHHYDAYHHGGNHHHEAPHHRRPLHHGETYSHHPYLGSYHDDIPNYRSKHHHSQHHHGHHGYHDEHHHGEHHHGEHHHGEHHRGEHHHGHHGYHNEHHHGEHHRGEHHHGEHHHGEHHHGHHGYHDEHHHGEHHPGEHHPSEQHHDHRGEHHHREYRRGAHPYDYLHSIGVQHHGGSQVFDPLKPHSTARASLGSTYSMAFQPNLTRSHSKIRSHASQVSSKVHPQDSSSKSSESWAEEDEQFQKRETGRTQQSHKKLHTMDLSNWLWEKLSYFIQGLRRMLRNLTQSLAFEAFIFLIVCLNTIMLVAQTFTEVEIRGEWYFMALDSIFLSIYVIEALLKIIALGLKYFSDSWNNLDFFIMVMAVLDFMLMQLSSLSFMSVIYHQSVFRIFKVFKSLRALRAIRVLRRLSFLTSLQEVTGTLARSLPSITAILILMFTCLFLFSVVLRALFRQSDPKRFQNIFTTIFTLFTLLTLDDWSLIYLDSRAQGAWYIIPILMIYIIIQYFIFLNLVIAVLVDNFQMALLRGLEKVKQERAAQIHEKLLDDSLTELRKTEPEEEMGEHAIRKQLMEKKFGTMTEKQQELLFHFLQLVAGVEHHQQKFRSQASVIDEIVDAAFEAGEEDFRK